MGAFLRELRAVAPTNLAVLVLGPTGCGKELAARAIHRLSGRCGPLVPVNCSALAEGTLESELFGHVRGAFTGAARDRMGAVEAAAGGTLFLDEVADLSPRVQSMFLRVLQEKEVRRVGAERLLRVDVRFLAATHRPMEELARSGAFRRDLLFRLAGAELRLPGLDARRHEFGYLVPRLVVQVAAEAGLPAPDVAPALPGFLAERPWPGNFRQLRHTLARALWRREAAGAGPLAPEHLADLVAEPAPTGAWAEATRQFQRDLLLLTLRRHRFQVAEAARELGLARPALYAAARRLGVDLAVERAGFEGK